MAYKTIFKAGFIVGLLDILAACIQYMLQAGKSPAPVLKFIASGVFGKAAFAGGGEMIFFGLLFHFIIAIAFAAFFFVVVSGVSFFEKNKIITGVLYGLFVWLVMNFVVLPLSNAPKLPLSFGGAVLSLVILIVCIGIPLSFLIQIRNSRAQTIIGNPEKI
jgi:hypothetical protein